LLFISVVNIAAWKSSNLEDTGEKVGYGAACVLFVAGGLWLILRGRGLFVRKDDGN
jgi:hypothetical protein